MDPLYLYRSPYPVLLKDGEAKRRERLSEMGKTLVVPRRYIPRFTAEASLYRTTCAYRAIASTPTTKSVVPQLSCCGDTDTCCPSGFTCMESSGGDFVGCCAGTVCVDSNGELYCANESEVCCGGGACDTRFFTCCGGDTCLPKNEASCPPFFECLSPGVCKAPKWLSRHLTSWLVLID